MSHTSPSERCAEVIAALMWGPKTLDQLVEFTGANLSVLKRWLETFRVAGIVRIAGEVKRQGGGRRAQIWELQTRPHALSDWRADGDRRAERLERLARTLTAAPAHPTSRVDAPPSSRPAAAPASPAFPLALPTP